MLEAIGEFLKESSKRSSLRFRDLVFQDFVFKCIQRDSFKGIPPNGFSKEFKEILKKKTIRSRDARRTKTTLEAHPGIERSPNSVVIAQFECPFLSFRRLRFEAGSI